MVPAVTGPRTFSDATVQKGAWWQPLHDGFDGPGFSPLGGLYYRDNFEQSAGTMEFQRKVRLSGSGALKLTVRPIPGATGGDHSERAEIWERTDLWAPYGEGMWYGFAVRFADPIPQDNHRYLIAQWKREILPGAEGDFSPFLALRLTNGKLYATVETNYAEPAGQLSAARGVPTFFRPEKNQMRALVAVDESWTAADAQLFRGSSNALDIERHGNGLPQPSSGWIEFAIFAKPGPDGSGRIEIIANGKPVVTVKGPIGHADKGLGGRQYFKFGPYRAGHAGEWTLYYDHFRRSPDRRDVVG
jgi:hypothetical protein